MAANASRVRKMFDAHSSVLFRDQDSAAVTADGYSSALSLNELDGAYWQEDGEIPEGYLVIGILVEAIDLDAGSGSGEPIILSARVDDTSNMSDTPVVVGEIHVDKVGYYEIVVAAKDIPKLDDDSSGADKWIAVHVDLVTDGGNNDQSISYAAWIASSRRMGL